jgi:hypothetical protein
MLIRKADSTVGRWSRRRNDVALSERWRFRERAPSRSVLEQALQSDPVDERRSGQSGYLTLPGERGRMILHGLRGEGGSMEPEISPLTVLVATRSRVEAFGLPFLRGGRAGHLAWFSWAA